MSAALDVHPIRRGDPIPVRAGRAIGSFVCVDPGNDGAIVWSEWGPNARPERMLVHAFGTGDGLASWIRRHAEHLATSSTVLTEEALSIGTSAKGGGALHLALRSGLVAGSISLLVDAPVALVPPATWQTILGKDRIGKTEDGKRVSHTKARACELAELVLQQRYGMSLSRWSNKKRREGVADALCFAVWRALVAHYAAVESPEGTQTWLDWLFSSLPWWSPPLPPRPKRTRRTTPK